MPLSTYLGLADQPGRLDGHGPVAAGLARQIAADAAREQPLHTAWRCVVVDDRHGTVLGVGDPITTPRHDPPPRLARLVTAMEPTCVFPGCRLPAYRCDLDHRIPYRHPDPDHPGDRRGEPNEPGARGGGATCSCNLQPLCRGHHRLKTAGALKVSVVDHATEPGVAPGTLEWTLPSGVTVRRAPTVADPGPLAARANGTHPHVAAARHVAATAADRWDGYPDSPPTHDWAADTWTRSRPNAAAGREHARELARQAAERQAPEQGDLPPF
jgi:hypothetical protein